MAQVRSKFSRLLISEVQIQVNHQGSAPINYNCANNCTYEPLVFAWFTIHSLTDPMQTLIPIPTICVDKQRLRSHDCSRPLRSTFTKVIKANPPQLYEC